MWIDEGMLVVEIGVSPAGIDMLPETEVVGRLPVEMGVSPWGIDITPVSEGIRPVEMGVSPHGMDMMPVSVVSKSPVEMGVSPAGMLMIPVTVVEPWTSQLLRRLHDEIEARRTFETWRLDAVAVDSRHGCLDGHESLA